MVPRGRTRDKGHKWAQEALLKKNKTLFYSEGGHTRKQAAQKGEISIQDTQNLKGHGPDLTGPALNRGLAETEVPSCPGPSVGLARSATTQPQHRLKAWASSEQRLGESPCWFIWTKPVQFVWTGCHPLLYFNILQLAVLLCYLVYVFALEESAWLCGLVILLGLVLWDILLSSCRGSLSKMVLFQISDCFNLTPYFS